MTWEFFLKHWGQFSDSSTYLEGRIPPKKLFNALQTYAMFDTVDTIYMLYDNTVFGSAKDGLVLSQEAVSWRENPLCDTVRIKYKYLTMVEHDPLRAPKKLIVNDQEFNVILGDDPPAIAAAICRVLRARMRES